MRRELKKRVEHLFFSGNEISTPNTSLLFEGGTSEHGRR
jgi:hypothetical protein